MLVHAQKWKGIIIPISWPLFEADDIEENDNINLGDENYVGKEIR